MKIYTKTGDKGDTGLFGGTRISKNSGRIEAYGTIDELNSFIGLAVIEVQNEKVKILLKKIQNQLFAVGADLAAPDTENNNKKIERISPNYYLEAETAIDEFEFGLEPLKNFILPGGSRSSAILHICRTIARRAERSIVALAETEKIGENIIIFLNRLSDLFFVLARYENKAAGIEDIKWEK